MNGSTTQIDRDTLFHCQHITLVMICVCFVGRSLPAQTPRPLSIEASESAVHINLAPENVFSSPANDSVTLTSFAAERPRPTVEPSTTEEAHHSANNNRATASPFWDSSSSRTPEASAITGLPNQTSVTDILPRLVGVTVLVLVTCAASLWLARRWMIKNGMASNIENSSRLAVTATLSIASHGQVHIVQVDDREFLAATNTQGVQQLVAIPPAFADLLPTPNQREAA